MLKEAINRLADLAREGKKIAIVPGIDDPRKVYVDEGGQLKHVEIPPPPRNHTVGSLQDLIEYASRLADDKVGLDMATPVIWHNGNRVCLVIDDRDRRDVVTFPLTTSVEFDAIEAAPHKPLTQPQLIRLLRFKLGADAALIDKFRRLDWRHSTEGRVEVRHGKESLGKEILAKVEGVDELPEEIVVEIPLYEQQGEREEYEIRLGIEIDTVNQQFGVAAMPGALRAAVDSHQDTIHSRLVRDLHTKKDIPIYYGSP